MLATLVAAMIPVRIAVRLAASTLAGPEAARCLANGERCGKGAGKQGGPCNRCCSRLATPKIAGKPRRCTCKAHGRTCGNDSQCLCTDGRCRACSTEGACCPGGAVCQSGACETPVATFADCQGACSCDFAPNCGEYATPPQTMICGQRVDYPPCARCFIPGVLFRNVFNLPDGTYGNELYCTTFGDGTCDPGECPAGQYCTPVFCDGGACEPGTCVKVLTDR